MLHTLATCFISEDVPGVEHGGLYPGLGAQHADVMFTLDFPVTLAVLQGRQAQVNLEGARLAMSWQGDDLGDRLALSPA